MRAFFLRILQIWKNLILRHINIEMYANKASNILFICLTYLHNLRSDILQSLLDRLSFPFLHTLDTLSDP